MSHSWPLHYDIRERKHVTSLYVEADLLKSEIFNPRLVSELGHDKNDDKIKADLIFHLFYE